MGVHRRVKTQDGVIVASVQIEEQGYEVTSHAYVGRIGDYSTTGEAVDIALADAEHTARRLLAKQKQEGFEEKIRLAAAVDDEVKVLQSEVEDLKSANADLQGKIKEQGDG